MSEQMTLRLDDRLAAGTREAAAASGSSVSDWPSSPMRYLVVSSDAYNAASADRRVIAVEVDPAGV